MKGFLPCDYCYLFGFWKSCRSWTHRTYRLHILQPALFQALLNQKRWTLSGYLVGALLLVMPSLPRVFNYITLTDTLLYINCVKLGNQAATLSQTIAPLSQAPLHY